MAGNLQSAFNSIVQACNDPNIGYSASPLRTTITLGSASRTYCDCSSLMAWGLTQGGFFNVNPWFTTANEVSCLLQAGFQQLPNTVDLLPGDIVWADGYVSALGKERHHTEMVYEAFGTNARTMGAHTDSYEFPRQVSINDYMVSGTSYNAVFRYGGGGVVPVNISWIQTPENEQRHMTEEETYNNAILIAFFLTQHNFTQAAIAAVIANSEYESAGINPNCWQSFTITPSNGYGIFQYTPSTKYMTYAQEKGIDRSDADQNGNGQLQYLIDKDGEWGGTYPISWEGFQQMTDPVAATEAFMRNFERPGSYSSLPQRQERARYWYSEIPNFPANIGNPQGPFFPYLPGIICDLKRRKRLL